MIRWSVLGLFVSCRILNAFLKVVTVADLCLYLFVIAVFERKIMLLLLFRRNLACYVWV